MRRRHECRRSIRGAWFGARRSATSRFGSAARLAGDASLNAPIGGDGDSGEWQDWLVDEAASPERAMVESEELELRRKALGEALGVLNDRERRIFEVRRLADDPITLEEQVDEFGVSRERVRQIETRARRCASTSSMSWADTPLMESSAAIGAQRLRRPHRTDGAGLRRASCIPAFTIRPGRNARLSHPASCAAATTAAASMARHHQGRCRARPR
jgi:hypothetical protein